MAGEVCVMGPRVSWRCKQTLGRGAGGNVLLVPREQHTLAMRNVYQRYLHSICLYQSCHITKKYNYNLFLWCVIYGVVSGYIFLLRKGYWNVSNCIMPKHPGPLRPNILTAEVIWILLPTIYFLSLPTEISESAKQHIRIQLFRN